MLNTRYPKHITSQKSHTLNLRYKKSFHIGGQKAEQTPKLMGYYHGQSIFAPSDDSEHSIEGNYSTIWTTEDFLKRYTITRDVSCAADITALSCIEDTDAANCGTLYKADCCAKASVY